MATHSRADSSSFDRARISGNLHARFDGFFRCLKLRVLEGAFRQAEARKVRGVVSVSERDLLHSARALLPRAAAEFSRALKQHETGHARRRAS
jgi:hypothetical protein